MHLPFTSAFLLRVAAVGALSLFLFAGRAAESQGRKSPVAATTGASDACSFIPKSELERLVGRELRDGKPEDMPPGLSQCDFTTPPQMYVKRRFNNPPLPDAAGFSSIVITTFPTTSQSFEESRRLLQTEGGEISGIGDGAFLNGPARIFARVGNRGFSIRLHVNSPSTEAGRTRLREVMLSLARAGVAKL